MAFSIHTMAEAAKTLGIGKETLRNRARVAKFTVHKVGKIELITGDEIELLKQMGEPQRGRPRKQRS